ncbi:MULTISPECIES: hypothetical protein [unclassified Rathayibacter]|uniref:hypothetical protein n=1 Tax=unclassified Rathayibacter TaxID=2609250 RepID=UPI000CE8047B|nr:MULTISPECIES: hypothetical protein [unclassified Rathayibacter]PPF24957.1 hypothetical protein C5C54_15710 [Rathayibacter sp. AY1F2]PPH41012.1 hypothetical protein C5C42_16955 [Rathayibacter sp. AY1F7]
MLDGTWIEPPPAPVLAGQEHFDGVPATVADFWRFALSDFRTNNARGYLAEFLVARALGLDEVTRTEWDAYDLVLDDMRIEIKSSGYLQAWKQRVLSPIQFSGLRGTRHHPDHGYDPSGKQLNAHVYVFCVQTAQQHEQYRPLDLHQWDFYVVSRGDLEVLGSNSIGLKAVVTLAGQPTPWSELRDAVTSAAVGQHLPDLPWWTVDNA